VFWIRDIFVLDPAHNSHPSTAARSDVPLRAHRAGEALHPCGFSPVYGFVGTPRRVCGLVWPGRSFCPRENGAACRLPARRASSNPSRSRVFSSPNPTLSASSSAMRCWDISACCRNNPSNACAPTNSRRRPATLPATTPHTSHNTTDRTHQVKHPMLSVTVLVCGCVGFAVVGEEAGVTLREVMGVG